jgi:hypothetical protein
VVWWSDAAGNVEAEGVAGGRRRGEGGLVVTGGRREGLICTLLYSTSSYMFISRNVISIKITLG